MQEYRAALGSRSTKNDPEVERRVLSASRFVDMCTEGHDGRFNSVTQTRYFNGNGLDEIRVDEFNASTTLKVDTTGDGTFDTTVASGDRFNLPHNASLQNRPFDRIKLRPENTTLSAFSSGFRRIELAADWGWAAVPPLIRDCTIQVAHDLWDLMEAGSTLTLGQVDVGVRLSPDTNNLIRQIKSLFGAKVEII